jgi:hypothetical protein
MAVKSFPGIDKPVQIVTLVTDNGDGTTTAGSHNPLPAGTDRSGSIAAGGTAQSMAPANAARKSLKGQNISAGDLWINEVGGTAAVDTAGSYKVTSGSAFAIATNRAVSIVGATTGQKWTATET